MRRPDKITRPGVPFDQNRVGLAFLQGRPEIDGLLLQASDRPLELLDIGGGTEAGLPPVSDTCRRWLAALAKPSTHSLHREHRVRRNAPPSRVRRRDLWNERLPQLPHS